MEIFGASVWQLALAVVAYMVIGAVWYSPLLFAKAWMKAVGKSSMGDNYVYIGAVFGEFMAVLGLAYVGNLIGLSGWMAGAMLGLIVWLFFVTSTSLINSTFQGKAANLYLIDMGYHLVGLVVAGAIVAL
ncbi:MAG TPA: DUF1761 domain-containing protein [Candidatus Saccharimonas sp.]|nr:DUF1761 domain-containing protein [Candidatus Saccharimonas sp.]